MKPNTRINFIFWKQGPLLFVCAQSRLPCLPLFNAA